MARKAKETRERRALIEEIHMAGRVLSTAAVLFHTALAERQGLSATETKTIDLLERFGPLTAGELGQRSGLAPASVTGLVDRLEKKGYARRIADPADGRRVLIELDRSRLAEFAPLFVDFMGRMEAILAELSSSELETILRYLTEAAKQQTIATAALAGGTHAAQEAPSASGMATKPKPKKRPKRG